MSLNVLKQTYEKGNLNCNHLGVTEKNRGNVRGKENVWDHRKRTTRIRISPNPQGGAVLVRNPTGKRPSGWLRTWAGGRRKKWMQEHERRSWTESKHFQRIFCAVRDSRRNNIVEICIFGGAKTRCPVRNIIISSAGSQNKIYIGSRDTLMSANYFGPAMAPKNPLDPTSGVGYPKPDETGKNQLFSSPVCYTIRLYSFAFKSSAYYMCALHIVGRDLVKYTRHDWMRERNGRVLAN